MSLPPIALGSANFGLSYGIANNGRQLLAKSVSDLLVFAWSAGIRNIDTAISYGVSEEVLGQNNLTDWRVVTKLPPIPEGVEDIEKWVSQAVMGSLKRLCVPSLHAILLHRPQDLLERHGPILRQALRKCQDEGIVLHVGVSIYDPEELDGILRVQQIDVVQAPFNIFDRRLVTSGWAVRLRNQGCQIQGRSLFLQGLLLMQPEERPTYFKRWQPLWDHWHRWLSAEGLTPLQGCLQPIIHHGDLFDKVVIGVDSAFQLQEILEAGTQSLRPLPEDLTTRDKVLLNPSRWNLS